MEALILCLLDKNPAKRVQTAHDLGRQLAKIAIKHGYQISMTHVTPLPFPAHEVGPTSKTEFAPEIEVAHTSADPTTLSRSAAESVMPSAPRRAIAWYLVPALAVAAAVVVGVFTFGQIRDDTKPAASAPAPLATPPAPPPPPVEAKPVEPPPPVETPVETKPAEPPPPVEVKPAVVKAKPKPKPKQPKPAPVEAAKPNPPEPPKKKPAGPMETDI